MQPEVKWLMDHLDQYSILPEMQEAMDKVEEWANWDHGYQSKNQRIQEWSTVIEDIYGIVTHIFAGTLLNPEGMTYQAMIGYISGSIGCKDPLDRAKCAAEIIALCYQANLITITKVSDKTMLITTEFDLGIEIPEFGKHIPQFKKPEPVAYNPILGNLFKQHDMDTSTDHIDRMNAIPLVLEHRVLEELPESLTKTEFDTDEQKEQWIDFVRRSWETYGLAMKHEQFYLNHSFDTRGRCYCSGYYINYQGSSYKKAIVQLANKEIIQL